jgi:hypothetical protein
MAVRVSGVGLLECRAIGVVVEPTLHSGQLPQRNSIALRDPNEVFGDRIVQADVALINKLHRGHREGFCFTADLAVEVGVHCGAGGFVGDPDRAHGPTLRSPHADDCAGDRRRAHRIIDGAVKPPN